MRARVRAALVFGAIAAFHPLLSAADRDLDRAQAEAAVARLWAEKWTQVHAERAGEMESRIIECDGKRMRFAERVFGDAPQDGRSLWISMHGGGGAPAPVNDRQWRNQAGLYEPKEGIYIAPRAPTDHWNLWHEPHIDPMFARLIEDCIALRGVNPDRVYLMGYSAGGDGVWQLAPRMADRWAAAAMMAGHPNDASLLALRNLPIALFVGAKDAAYNRNRVVPEKAAELDRLEKADPGGYPHALHVYDTGHWMNRLDAEALPWMAEKARDPWPKKIVWVQDDVTHERFYWLGVPAAAAKPRQKIVAEADGQTIRLSGDVPDGTTLWLNDALLDLDQPVRVLLDGVEVFHSKAPRRAEVIRESLDARADPRLAATAKIDVSL